MDQIRRITLMENHLNSGIEAVAELKAALDNYEKVSKQIDLLFQYYGSATWFKDFEDDRANKRPADLNREVLSETETFKFRTEYKELLKKIKEFKTKID